MIEQLYLRTLGVRAGDFRRNIKHGERGNKIKKV